MKYCTFDEQDVRPCDIMAMDCDGCEYCKIETVSNNDSELEEKNKIIQFLLEVLEHQRTGAKAKALEIILNTWGD